MSEPGSEGESGSSQRVDPDRRDPDRRDPDRPTYKGAPLDAERGPGLGCFWIQVVLLVVLLVATPISVWLAAPPWVSAAFLLVSLGLLFFVGQTAIFLLRLVAADRRAQRRPLRQGARPTVGQLDEKADVHEDTTRLDQATSDEGPS